MFRRSMAWILILGIGLLHGGARCMVATAADTPRDPASETDQSPPAAPAGLSGSTPAIESERILAALEQQKNLLTRELGQVKREVAALRGELEKPGLRDIMAGLGYILGLAGIALFWMRRKPPAP